MSLRVFVQVWCEIDPTLNVRVDRQTGIPIADQGDRLERVSPLGRAGVAAAAELGGAVVTAFALGTGHIDALRHALAAGAERAVELVSPGQAKSAVSVTALAAWLRQQQADLVIADRLAGRVAARLAWSHLAGLGEVTIAGGALRAVRSLERGDREMVTARLPAAVRLQVEPVCAPYVACSRIEAVSGRAIEQETLGECALSHIENGPLQVARARTRLGKQPSPAGASASARLQALLSGGTNAPPACGPAEKDATTPQQMAEEFVRYLLHHNLLSEL
jgi:electron transfer flavoprotein alpha/beta subunit